MGVCSFAPGRAACCGAGVHTGQPTMRVSVTSTTGSPVELTVPRGETVEGLRTHISKKLRLQTDRIVLLHRHKQLTAGKLLDLGVTNGSELTLVPVIEAGFLCSTARAQRSTMDILESLTEVQIGDFLSGRSPLTINLGFGTHKMHVQLQLSAQNVTELQHNQDLRAQSSSKEIQTSRTSHLDSARINATSATASFPDSAPTPGSSDSTSTTQFRPTFSTACEHLPPHQPCPSHSTHTSSSISHLSLASACACTSCPLQAATSVCSADSNPGPQSPVPASAIKQDGVNTSSPAELCEHPGAVIESFVSHSPGVFSGTFSGTLAPGGQSGIAIILQILNDLLKAAYHHQEAVPAHSHLHCPPSNPPVSLLTAEEQSKAKSQTLVTQREEQLGTRLGEESRPLHSSTQENQALHCKLECLQFMMQQRRLRKRTRNISQTSHPYQKHPHRP